MGALAVKEKLASGSADFDDALRIIAVAHLVADLHRESVAANDELTSATYYDAETGLYYGGARYWDPRIGRSLTPDRMSVAQHVRRWQARLGTRYQLPLELNPYAYVANNPLRWTDRTGFAIGDFPPSPPGWNPGWPTGQYGNGTWWTEPSYGGGERWLAHPEDKEHWRHWDIFGPNGKKKGSWPDNPGKPRSGQKKLKPNQCPVDPNADPEQWTPPVPETQPEVPTPPEAGPETDPIPFMPWAEPFPVMRGVPVFEPVFVP